MIDAMTSDTSLALMQMQQTDIGKYSGIKNEKKLEEAAKEFEAVFVSEMMKPMFEGIEVDETFGGGQAEKIFRGMMLQEFGKTIAETGRVGIAPHIKEAMIKLQEQQSSNTQAKAA